MNTPAWLKKVPMGAWMVLLLGTYGIYYGYQNLIPLEPQSLHSWRQSDCASWSWNYYKGSANFFEGEMNNRLGNGTGQVLTELPIIYYAVGMLWRVFGHHPWMYRLLTILLVYAGLYCLHRTVWVLLKDKFWALTIPLLVYSAPVLAFFTNAFIPDPVALSFAFMGWYGLVSHIQTGKMSQFWWGMAGFLMSILLKASMAVSFITVLSLFMMEWIPGIKLLLGRKHEVLFKGKKWIYLLGFLGVGLLSYGWYVYATWYSTRFEHPHFSGIIRDFFSAEAEHRDWMIRTFFAELLDFLYHPTIHYLIWGLAAILVLRIGRPPMSAFWVCLLLILGQIAYTLLFFQLMLIHQYYHIVNLMAPTALFILGAWLMLTYLPRVSASPIFRFLWLGFLFFNLYHAKMKIQRYYYDKPEHYKQAAAFYDEGLENWLDSIGLTEDQTVISMPDPSPNQTLYLMRRKGWSSFNNPNHTAQIVRLLVVHEDLDYILINDTTLLNDPVLQPALREPLGSFKGLHAFKAVQWEDEEPKKEEDVPRGTSSKE
ncbi:MAG: hypothetical protein AAFR61_04960 [Bacteroidota bacterium]